MINRHDKNKTIPALFIIAHQSVKRKHSQQWITTPQEKERLDKTFDFLDKNSMNEGGFFSLFNPSPEGSRSVLPAKEQEAKKPLQIQQRQYKK
ncbi:hypothetical protein [Bartonella sp. AU55XJBT]|uniref:hypothetical protein n=1 Tax=Bartonella sp. AU55XJBT TaxID=3019091 RepID=UPI00235FCC3E|nr:hypothetical protein [Bartonella sp. AU55XJBT]